MTRFARVVVLSLVAAVTGGCITTETLFRINADGSGTVEQTLLINTKALEAIPMMLASAMGGGKVQSSGGKDAAFDPSEFFNEEQARRAVDESGGRVRFVSFTNVKRGTLNGATVVYAFDDVNAFASDLASGVLDAGGPGTGPGGLNELRLTRQPNGRSLLTMTLAEPKPSRSKTKGASFGKAGDTKLSAEANAMMLEIVKGTRVAVEVEVNGAIVHTNAPHVVGSRVTLVEMDLEALMKDKENLRRLDALLGPDWGFEDVQALPAQMNGARLSPSPVTIEFTAR